MPVAGKPVLHDPDAAIDRGVASGWPIEYGPPMRMNPLLVAGFLGLAGVFAGGVLAAVRLRSGAEARETIYRWENGRCYRLRFAIHGALSSARYETSAGKCPPVDPKRPPTGMEWWAVADCHFSACAADSLTASIAKRRDFVSYVGYGPSEREACENAKYHLQHMLQGDQCTPTKCECTKAARGAQQDGVDSARRSNAGGERLPE